MPQQGKFLVFWRILELLSISCAKGGKDSIIKQAFRWKIFYFFYYKSLDIGRIFSTFDSINNKGQGARKIKNTVMENHKNTVKCPACGSTNVAQVADHSSHGYNGYVCGNCNTRFGN